MIDAFDTLQEIGDELGKRATVGTFIVVVGSAEAAARIPTPHLTPMMALHRYDRTDREKSETYLRCVKVALSAEAQRFLDTFGALPKCFQQQDNEDA